jgi:hypothetical protein
MRTNILFLGVVLLLLVQTSCKKETRYIYQVQEQELYQNSSQKQNLKTTSQFITIAYNDLFNTTISIQEMNKMNVDLQAFGDKGIIQDMIVKALLNKSGTIIPTATAMRADIPGFVQQSYLRFYNRKPTEFEAWKMKDMIDKNPDITPQMVYYALMTSNEYRYY